MFYFIKKLEEDARIKAQLNRRLKECQCSEDCERLREELYKEVDKLSNKIFSEEDKEDLKDDISAIIKHKNIELGI